MSIPSAYASRAHSAKLPKPTAESEDQQRAAQRARGTGYAGVSAAHASHDAPSSGTASSSRARCRSKKKMRATSRMVKPWAGRASTVDGVPPATVPGSMMRR